MGEIGFPRKEFLHELKWWEVQSIIRGYQARHHAGWEQARLIAYQARYCMGVPKGESVPLLTDWIKFKWEHKEPPATLTEEERKQMQREANEIGLMLFKQLNEK